MEAEPDVVGGPSDRFVLALGSLVFSAAFVVIGVGLLSTCAVSPASPGSPLGCAYPFQDAGAVFLYVAVVLFSASLVLFVHDGRVRSRPVVPGEWWSAGVVAVTLVVVATVVLVLYL
jgi:hypothetical protein